MGDSEAAEMPKSEYFRNNVRTSDEVICELSFERKNVAEKLENLKFAINANHDSVSEKHKELWKKQAKAMQEYVDVLGERIKDLIGE